MRLKIIGNEILKNVCKSQSCMVSKVPIICKRAVRLLARVLPMTEHGVECGERAPANTFVRVALRCGYKV